MKSFVIWIGGEWAFANAKNLFLLLFSRNFFLRRKKTQRRENCIHVSLSWQVFVFNMLLHISTASAYSIAAHAITITISISFVRFLYAHSLLACWAVLSVCLIDVRECCVHGRLASSNVLVHIFICSIPVVYTSASGAHVIQSNKRENIGIYTQHNTYIDIHTHAAHTTHIINELIAIAGRARVSCSQLNSTGFSLNVS